MAKCITGKLNNLAYFPFPNYPKRWKFIGNKEWRRETVINTQVEKVWTPAIITTAGHMWPQNQDWVRVWAMIMLLQHVPGPDHLQPVLCGGGWVGGGGDKSYKASRRRSSCKDQRVPSQAILSATSPVISREWLLSLHADADSWQADLFLLLRAEGWVMACCCCSTFVMCLLFFFFQSFCLTWDLSLLRQRSRDTMLCFWQLWNYNSLTLPASWTWLVWSASISSSWGV